MKRKQKIALGVAVSAISAITLLGAGVTYAYTSNDDMTSRIASKLNISKTEVEKVLTEFQTQQKADRTAARSADLQAKVDAGTITSAQKTLIENKIKEIEAERESNKDNNLSRDEMHSKMEANRTALEKWATDNRIDVSLVMPGGGHGMDGPNMGPRE